MSEAAPATETPACPLCGGHDAAHVRALHDRVWARPGEFGLVRCGGCALAYLSPRPTVDGIGFYYRDMYSAKGVVAEEKLQRSAIARGLNAGRARALFRRRRPVRGDRHVDVGCGVGGFLETIATRTEATAVGVDFDGEAIASAQRNAARRGLALELHEGTLAAQAFPAASFATASMIHFLEHSFDPRAELAEAHRVLAPGGAIVVEVPSERSLARRVFGESWFPYLTPQHVTLFSRATLARALEGAGFREVRVRDVWAPLVWLASFIVWYQHVLGKNSRFVDALWAKLVSVIVLVTIVPAILVGDLAISIVLPWLRHGEHIQAVARRA